MTGTIALTSGELAITDPVDLHGPGSGVITVSGNNTSRVVYVTANATISGLTITGGNADSAGGLYNAYGATTVLHNSIISGNLAFDFHGGGIYNAGTLTVSNCILSGNSAFYFGGGISNDGTLTVTDTMLSGN